MHTLSARRELALVFALAVLGVGLVVLVAFAPWYGSVSYGDARPAIVETTPPVSTIVVEAVSSG
ncbi:hypothetical protein [Couchioplanes caeruleus]|uniref:Uncharacterized protein n=2 Tax=Couchioplanes caeruleus TaxID=56438 RepID=A0A1K0GN60_9ACTN|nr:hypothetical protein [Couchioplanes caeruleus]OJF12508.1 hypothetical protein BG844_20315 [Couchioplanes caeruleus subsp. caeruleus]ROP32119.1 hypothetical protein EDD30_5049 [Couchioplanes caeruleus]